MREKTHANPISPPDSREYAGPPKAVPMHLSRLLCLASLGVLAFLPVGAAAQGLTATIVGSVKDSEGGVVRVTSPALIGSERQTVSDGRGQWRLPVLPPGSYVLAIEMASKFAPHRETIALGAGETVVRAVVLQLPGVVESVTVDGTR